MPFHEVRFPTDISRGAQGGPERRTDVVTLGSGFEERNARWADSRRSYNAGYGVRTLDDLDRVVAFFEERRGRLHGFRWRDPADWKSCSPSRETTAGDQIIGEGDGVTAVFTLTKTYGAAHAPYRRAISKPVADTVFVAVAGEPVAVGTAAIVDITTGRVIFQPGHVPPVGVTITAGFAFDVPVRFDTDRLMVSVQGFHHGAIPDIPIVEIRL
ncbi:MAG: DUF2460 domain-containing protein [Rhodospirillales bacterium]|nr:DUF2460 domain-containing protein [Rhodospirillales bacterium]